MKIGLLVTVVMLSRTLLGQCEPGGMHVFSAVRDVKEAGGPAGVELIITERGASQITGLLRDYEGSPSPLETTLRGKLVGCDLVAYGRGKRGQVEVRGRINAMTFDGEIRRKLGNRWYTNKLSLKRRLPESDNRVAEFLLHDLERLTAGSLAGSEPRFLP